MVAARSYGELGVVKGQPRRYATGHGGRAPRRPRPEKFKLTIMRVRGRRPKRYRLRVVQVRRSRWLAEDRGFETPCWIWRMSVDKRGYGKVTRGKRRLKAHRVAFEDAIGPIPPGHDVHHRCEQKLCMRPDHLEALTPAEHGQLHGAVWRKGHEVPLAA